MLKKIFPSFLIGVVALSTAFSFSLPVQAANDYSGKLVKLSTSSSLYYVASDGKRYVFPNEKTFRTWFLDFDDVVTISSEELAAMPIGGNVVYRPGVLLVKITTDPRIYAVSKNGTLRWVETEAIVKALYGDNWNKLVDDVPDSFFVNYRIGSSIGNVSDYDVDSEIDDVRSIDYNYGLATSQSKTADTSKCRYDGGRQCRGSGYDSDHESDGDDSNDNYSNTGNPYIKNIKVLNGGEKGYIDVGDTIAVTFSEEIDPESVHDDLDLGDSVNDIAYSQTGGVRVASSGEVTIKNIASFDMGGVDFSESFVSKLALNSDGTVLTITLTSGSDIEILEEDFDDTIQTGGTIEDNDGNEMQSDSDINEPTGTFGGVESNAPYITNIKVSNGGEDGYIDVGDTITITFSEAIDPKSISSDLDEGDSVDGISYQKTGGVRVSSSGKVTVDGITSFDMGSVDYSETFIVELDLNSTGKVLTITLTNGSDVEITDEDLDDASQEGGVIKDNNGTEMESKSSISDPEGTFGGSFYDEDGNPYITSIEVEDGGEEGFIDIGDTITINFNEAIEPTSINDDLDEGGVVNNVLYSETGGVRVTSSGQVVISDIAIFDAGSVEYSETFIVELALSSSGKELTITLTGGSDVEITEEDLDDASQTGDTVEDLSGNKMESDSAIPDPTGTFGGEFDDGNDADSDPYITSIVIANGGEVGYIDVDDTITITFNEAIRPDSINNDLEEGEYVTGISYSETGGVRVSSSGKISINDIASFDVGSVEDSETFTVKLSLSDNGKELTITLTSGSSVQIDDEDFSDASQEGGTIEDQDENEMNSDSVIDNPTGTFGGELSSGSDNGSDPYIESISISNGGDAGYIDVGDIMTITFSEDIDPNSVNGSLEAGDDVSGVIYSNTGGVSVFSSGAVIIEGIAVFDVGTVSNSSIFSVRLALSSSGDVLTITLLNGGDVNITNKDFNSSSQTGGVIEDEQGNDMNSTSLSSPSGSF